jgi:predicted nuclease of predicted toxin-antitoxin system
VKLLFDENLSRKLVARLSELYPGSAHMAEVNLLERPDREIWDFAQKRGFIIVTTDADFYELAAALGPPPKVIWLRRWRHPTRDAEFVLRRDAIRITEFAADSTLGFLCWTASKPAFRWCQVTSRLSRTDVPERRLGPAVGERLYLGTASP